MNNSNSALDSDDGGFKSAANFIAEVEKYAVPVICSLGFIGNTLSFLVFAQKCMRSKSCSLFLAARSLSDNGFLATLLIMWVSSVLDLRLSRIAGICQVFVFLTYVFGCLSVWLVVFVTIENYIRICKPFMVNTLCKSSKAKYAVILLLFIVLCCYNFPLWTMADECTPHTESYNLLKIMMYADSLLTFLVPTVIISFLLSRIFLSSISSDQRRRRFSTVSVQSVSNLTAKVTTMLLAVTLIFILLNLPLHVTKLRLLVISFIKDQIDIYTPFDVICQSIAQLIYYLSVTINFFVYYRFGGLFRRAFKDMFSCKNLNINVWSNRRPFRFSTQKRRQSIKPAEIDFNNFSMMTVTKDVTQCQKSAEVLCML